MYGLKNVDSRATEVKIMINVKSALLIELGLGGKIRSDSNFSFHSDLFYSVPTERGSAMRLMFKGVNLE